MRIWIRCGLGGSEGDAIYPIWLRETAYMIENDCYDAVDVFYLGLRNSLWFYRIHCGFTEFTDVLQNSLMFCRIHCGFTEFTDQTF